MLKGHVFDLQTFTSKCFALFIDTFLNKNNGIVQGCTISNTNTSITINSGFFVIAGRFLEIITNETVIFSEDGFYQLICEIDLNQDNTITELKQAKIKLIHSTVNYTELTKDNLGEEGSIYQYQFAKFKVVNGVMTDYTDTRTYINIQSIYNTIENSTEELIIQIQNTLNNVLDESIYVLKSGGAINGNLEISGNCNCDNMFTKNRNSICNGRYNINGNWNNSSY